jgi:putative oxidoreductase
MASSGETRRRGQARIDTDRVELIAMKALDPGRSAQLSGWALSLLRMVAAALFIEHGMQKYFGFPIPFPMGEIHPFSLFGFAGALELAGGALLLLGLFTRPAAFLLSGEMAVAYFMAHAPQGFYPIANGGEAAILYCFIFLLLAVAGPGPLSIDILVWERRRAANES